MMEPNARGLVGADETGLPVKLVGDLAALRPRPVPVPEPVERTILAAAEAKATEIRLASATGDRPRIVRLARWAAAAAACAALAAGAAWLFAPGRVFERSDRNRDGRTDVLPVRTFARSDLNRDGRTDVLDAFLLARRIEARAAIGRECDQDGDGRVDKKDVDAIAMLAVRLPAGGAR